MTESNFDTGPKTLQRQSAAEVFPISHNDAKEVFHGIVKISLAVNEQMDRIEGLLRQQNQEIDKHVLTRTFPGFIQSEIDDILRPSYRYGVQAAYWAATLSAENAISLTGVGAIPPVIETKHIERHEAKTPDEIRDRTIAKYWDEQWGIFKCNEKYRELAEQMDLASSFAPYESAFKAGIMDFAGWVAEKEFDEAPTDSGSGLDDEINEFLASLENTEGDNDSN